MNYFVKSILLGIVLDVPGVNLDNLQEQHYFWVQHEYVTLEVWGKIEYTKDRAYIKWDMKNPDNLKRYLKAKEELVKTPVPYGST